MQFYKVTWQQLEDDCISLTKKIEKVHIDRILCISRGGLVWSRMFSDLLGNVPVSHLTATSYTGIHQRKEVKISDLPDEKFIINQSLLIVDEIADHGNTFKKIKEYLHKFKNTKYYTLAPIIRSYTDPKPDFYLRIIDDWVIYPYEIRETKEAMKNIKS